MIDFDLSDDHRLLQRTVRESGAREIAPHIREDDRQHRFDRERVLGGMAKLGLLGVSVPQRYGAPAWATSRSASSAKSSSTWTPRCASSCQSTGLSCLTLLTWGTEAQKQQHARSKPD